MINLIDSYQFSNQGGLKVNIIRFYELNEEDDEAKFILV